MSTLDLAALAAIVTLILAGLAYMLPAIVAGWRNHHNLLAIAVLNLMLGWTVIGWIAALVWACTSPPRQRPS